MMPDARPRPKTSVGTRIGLFLLSAIAIALLPVVFRNITILPQDVKSISEQAVTAITVITILAGALTLAGAFYGLYAALWRPDGDKSA